MHNRRWRTGAAFAAGAALFAAGLAVFAYSDAGARGGGRNPIFDPPPAAAMSASFSAPDAGVDEPKHRHTSGGFAYGRPVCVRLCDGFFFPSNTASGGDASCEAQCPDAPTALYTEPAGSDRIEDAVSTTGASYTALPVALRHQSVFDNTCSCHRGVVGSYAATLMHDYTLRRGDVVMTPKGFVVFQGGGRSTFRPGDFVALAQSSAFAGDNLAALKAMERAALARRPRDAAPVAPATVKVQAALAPRARVRSVWTDLTATK